MIQYIFLLFSEAQLFTMPGFDPRAPLIFPSNSIKYTNKWAPDAAPSGFIIRTHNGAIFGPPLSSLVRRVMRHQFPDDDT